MNRQQGRTDVRILDVTVIDQDVHAHTERSWCSEDVTLEKMVTAAAGKGLRRFAITDHSYHIYFDREEACAHDKLHAAFAALMDKRADRMREYLEWLRQYGDNGVLPGMEVDMLYDGRFMFDWRFRDEVEVLIGAIHILPSLDRKPYDPDRVKEEFLHYTLLALDADIDILAHPTRPFRRAGLPIPEDVFEPVIEKAVKCGIALEINSHSDDPDPDFVRAAFDAGATLALGTDTHRMYEFGDFSFHKKTLEEAGIGLGEALARSFRIQG